MAQVIIQPSYASPAARRNWENTLAKEIAFTSGDQATALTQPQHAALDAMHPSGTARFWGVTSNHDGRIETLQTGDVVLFTGRNMVRGVGEVGCSFRNAVFADSLWHPHQERGSYHNVYSLLSFEVTEIPYEEIWDLPGFNPGDNFMGLRFLDDEKGSTLIKGLTIETITAAHETRIQERALAAALAAGTQLVDVEAVNTTYTSYERAAATTLVRRAEALLVRRYRQTLPVASEVGRIRTPAGITDLYIAGPDGVEIVEAKRSPEHAFIRQALGQLLDYAVHSPQPVSRLTALFPAAPSDTDVELLHRYGIDCVHQRAHGHFIRQPANQARRENMMRVWSTLVTP